MIGFVLRYFRRRRARRDYVRLTWQMTTLMLWLGHCWEQAARCSGSNYEAFWIEEAHKAMVDHDRVRDQRNALGVK